MTKKIKKEISRPENGHNVDSDRCPKTYREKIFLGKFFTGN